MNNIYESYTEKDLKQSIRQYLQELIMGNQVYTQQLRNLQHQLTATDLSNKATGKFANVAREKGYAYFALDLARNSTKRLAQMQQLYEVVTDITRQLLGLKELQYTVYYRDSDNKVIRLQTTHLSKAANWLLYKDKIVTQNQLHLNKSNIEAMFQKEINEARENEDYAKALSKHYTAFETLVRYKIQNSKKLLKYIPEAFERDLLARHENQDNPQFIAHKWTIEEAVEYLQQSAGTAPWYSGGDILNKLFNIQVKGFMSQSKESPFSAITGLTSVKSLQDMVNYLLTLLKITPAELEDKVDEIYNLFNQQSYEREIDIQIEEDSKKLLNKLEQSIGSDWVNYIDLG